MRMNAMAILEWFTWAFMAVFCVFIIVKGVLFPNNHHKP